MQEGSLFFTPSPAFIICRLFEDGHSDPCEVISHCSFDLHFSNNEPCWASFHVFVNHCMSSLEKCLFRFFFPTFWLGYLFFWYWVVWAACIFWKLILRQFFHLLLFSPSPRDSQETSLTPQFKSIDSLLLCFLYVTYVEMLLLLSLQLCPTLCDPIDSSPPGSPVPAILQARTLEWVAISFSNAWKWKVKGNSLSRVRLFATPWTAACQAPLSMGFSRQEYWSDVEMKAPQKLLFPSDTEQQIRIKIWSQIWWPQCYSENCKIHKNIG